MGNTRNHMAGFTLVELMVVLFIFSTMVFVAIPQFRGTVFFSRNNENQALAALVQSLKRTAVKENRDLFLHLDVLGQRAWASTRKNDQWMGEAMEADADNMQTDGTHNAVLDEPVVNLSLKGVEMINQVGLETENAVICFFSQGYSEKALILMGEGDNGVTLKISPFSWNVKIIQGHVSFHDCL